MHKLLLVDDDNYFRTSMLEFLKKKGFTVTDVPNGKIARELIATQDFDLIISDISMPGLTGLELMEWSLKVKKIPFIIMTGFSTLLETRSAFDLGAREFLTKPFTNSDFLTAIERALGIKKEYEVVETAEQYCKVFIDEFVAKPKIDFDVYVKLDERKYVKISHKGYELQVDRIQHYKSKGVKYLYIAREDFGKLVEFNLDLAHLIKDKRNISHEKKINFVKYTGEVLLEKMFVEGVDKQSFKEAQTFLQLTVNVISESKEHFDLLNLLNSHSDHIYAHSVGVSMYSVMIARLMGYESNTVFFKISMAAMFHDIGKKEIDRAILEKPRPLLSNEERRMVESHVARTQEILMSIKNIPEEIIQIVSEHHEDAAGLGYPQAKLPKKCHPLSPILQTANLFMEHALVGPNNPGMSGPSAIIHMEKTYLNRLDPKCMKALKLLFNVH